MPPLVNFVFLFTTLHKLSSLFTFPTQIVCLHLHFYFSMSAPNYQAPVSNSHLHSFPFPICFNLFLVLHRSSLYWQGLPVEQSKQTGPCLTPSPLYLILFIPSPFSILVQGFNPRNQQFLSPPYPLSPLHPQTLVDPLSSPTICCLT